MAYMPISRALVWTVVVVWFFGRAINPADCIAVEGETNATPSAVDVKVVAKTDASPATATVAIIPRADSNPLQTPQSTNTVEITLEHDRRPIVERVTVLAVIKPKLQETTLVIRPYVETN